MDMNRFYDYLTTFLLALIPISIVAIGYFMSLVPPELIAVVTIIVGILSIYAGNQRVSDAVETVKTWKWVHYLLTIIMIIVPILVTYQTAIFSAIPVSLVAPLSLLLAFLTQYVSGARVDNSLSIEDSP